MRQVYAFMRAEIHLNFHLFFFNFLIGTILAITRTWVFYGAPFHTLPPPPTLRKAATSVVPTV